MLLGDFLIQFASLNPEKTVLAYGNSTVSYGKLWRSSCSIADWLLAQKLEPGFRGILLTAEPFEYVASYFGIIIAGGVVVGLNAQITQKALEYSLADCGASALFINKRLISRLKKLSPDENLKAIAVTDGAGKQFPAFTSAYDLTNLLSSSVHETRASFPFRSSCDLAQIIYTSGTTGKPKGVMLRHSNLMANNQSIISYLGLTDKDRGMAVLPFFYSYGNSILLSHILAGASLVVNQSFMYPNVILEQMVKHKVTGFSGVPSTFALLLNRSAIKQYRFPSLRYITQAGAAMSPSLARRVHGVFPGTSIYIMYGQTEASARLAYLEPDLLEERSGSIGKAIPGVTLRLLANDGNPVAPGDTGEIVAQGENIMAGYWQRPEETRSVLRKEGLWTGDLAREDEDGFLYIVSRKSDIIKSGAHRIGPKEIEDTLSEHPAVQEVAVLGVVDEILDERIRACVVLSDECECSVKDLLKHCRKDLPVYKIPHEILFMEKLPKTATGKIKKVELKKL